MAPQFAKRIIGKLALVLMILASTAAWADTIISTFGQPATNVSPWGTPDSGSTPTYGQKFVAPADPWMQYFTFVVQNPNSQPIPFKAYIYKWDTTTKAITGPALFTSIPMSVPPTGSQFVNVTIAATDTILNPGDTYIAFFSTIGFTGNLGGSVWSRTTTASYPAGLFEYNNSATFSGLFAPPTPVWNDLGDLGNLIFEMNFTTYPSWYFWFFY